MDAVRYPLQCVNAQVWCRHGMVGRLCHCRTINGPELEAVGALLKYVEWTQQGKLPVVLQSRAPSVVSYVEMDAATRRSLELSAPVNGKVPPIS